MRTSSLLLSVLAALLLVVTACSSGGDDDGEGDDADGSATPTLTENDLAEAMLLVLDDLPASEGWVSEPNDDNGQPNPFDECETRLDPGTIGKADGGDFARRVGSGLSEDIRIFAGTDSLEAALERVEERGDCMAGVVEDGGLDANDVSFTDFTQQEVEYEEFGDQSRALRIQMTVNDLTGQEEPLQIYIDMIFVAIDTVGMRISASDVTEPYPADEAAEFIELAEEKVRDILENGPPDPTEEPTPTEQPTPTEEVTHTPMPTPANGSSLDEAIPPGESGNLADLIEAAIVDVNFDAEEVILAESTFNEPAPDGKVMVLVRAEITNIGTEPYDLSIDPSFGIVGEKAVVYDEFNDGCGGSIPERLTGELFPGGRKQGNVCLLVDSDDTGLTFMITDFVDFDEVRLFLALE